MTKLIAILIIVLAVFAGWKLVAYYQQVAEESQQKQKADTGADIRPEQLEGVPWNLNQSLEIAQRSGSSDLGKWLKIYGDHIRDPRKAWIEMDYCLALMRDDPNEARRVFKTVKDRTSTNSVIYPRLRQLEKTFE